MTTGEIKETPPLSAEEVRRMNAYWRAANYLSVGQIYLYDNPLLREPLKLKHVKPRLLGHWGTTPGLGRHDSGRSGQSAQSPKGLRGLSGLSADLRDLEQAALEKDKRAELALEVFAYRTCKYIGAFAAALEGLDGVAFTGGIGEHSASMRSRICQGLEFLGLRLDDELNGAANGRAAMQISVQGSVVQI